MNTDFDRVLSSADDLVPSSGFAASVMDAVRDAAGARPLLPFPWVRFIAGVWACLVTAAAVFLAIDYVDVSAVSGALREAGAELGYAIAVASAVVIVALKRSAWRFHRT